MARASSSMLCTARSVRYQITRSKGKKTKKFFFLPVLLGMTLVVLGAISYIGTRVKVVNTGYKINQELQKKEHLIEENKRLSLEIAQLKSPTRIETEAREKLGLKLPEFGQVLYAAKLKEGELAKNLALIRPRGATSLAKQDAVKEEKVSQATPAPKSVPKVAKVSRESTKPVAQAKRTAKASAPVQLASSKVAPSAKPKAMAQAKTGTRQGKVAGQDKLRVLIADRRETDLSGRPSKQLTQVKTSRNVPATLIDPIP